jgi:2-hydroxy-3-oxopropionate reductase
LHVPHRGKLPEAIAASTARNRASAAEVAARADIVFTMVPDTPDVESVLSAPTASPSALKAGGSGRARSSST